MASGMLAEHEELDLPRYSVCITNYNAIETIRSAVESVLAQVDLKQFEIVAVDNYSTDGSMDYLKHLEGSRIISKLVVAHCSRGKGRQLAFELSKGEYVIANIDTDVVYSRIMEGIALYHSNCEGKVLSVYGMMILPRKVAIEIGGWRDLDRHEDNDLAVRAYERGLHAQDLSFSVVKAHLKKPKVRKGRWIESYANFRDWFRIGMRISDVGVSIVHPTILIAFFLSHFRPKYPNHKFSEWYKIWIAGKPYGFN